MLYKKTHYDKHTVVVSLLLLKSFAFTDCFSASLMLLNYRHSSCDSFLLFFVFFSILSQSFLNQKKSNSSTECGR